MQSQSCLNVCTNCREQVVSVADPAHLSALRAKAAFCGLQTDTPRLTKRCLPKNAAHLIIRDRDSKSSGNGEID